MKKTAAFILFLVFLLHTFHTGILSCWFNTNRQWVAAELCVNKSRPAMKCNGKCFLSKKIKAAEEQQESGTGSAVKQTEDSLPYMLFTQETDEYGFDLIPPHYPAFKISYCFLHSNSHFHPPGCNLHSASI